MDRSKHNLIARTREHGNFRVGPTSTWNIAQKRWSEATGNGRNTAVTVLAFVDGKWTTVDGQLCVRSADDPMTVSAAVANSRKRNRYAATVRASDYRKVR